MENGTRLRASVMRALESHLVRCICCLASASFIFFGVLYQNCAVQGSESHLVFTFGLDVTERFESLSQSLLSSHESHGSLLLSRRKREENKKHIEQSVKERQKVCVSLGLIFLSKGWIIWGPVQIKCTFSPDKYHLVPRENNLFYACCLSLWKMKDIHPLSTSISRLWVTLNEQRGYFFFVIKMVSVIKITSGNHRPQSKNNFNEIDISGQRPSFLFLSHLCFLFGTDYLRRDWLVDW